MLAKTRLEVLIIPDRAPHEVYALDLGACDEQDAVADHAVAKQGRGIVQEDQVEPVARYFTAERARETPDRVLARGRARRVFPIEQEDRHVDIALLSCSVPGVASVQPGEAHRGIGGERAGESVAKAVNAPLTSWRGLVTRHVRRPPLRRMVPGHFARPGQPRTRAGSQVATPGTAIATSMNATMA